MIEEPYEKTFKMVKDYDVVNDVLYLRIIDEYKYKESLEISDNIILDFDENNIVVALEILEATTILKVPKFSIMNILRWNMSIDITEDLIDMEILTLMPIKQKKVEKTISTKTINNINIPPLQTTHFDLVKPVTI